MKLCDNIPGSEGEEIARRRVEEFANKLRPAAFVVRDLFALSTNSAIHQAYISLGSDTSTLN